MPCLHLDADYGCQLFGKPERPVFCGNLQPSLEMCGTCREEALATLVQLERLTDPFQS